MSDLAIWNPRIDEIINEFDLKPSEIKIILSLAPTAFDDIEKPIYYSKIKHKLPKQLQHKLHVLSETVDFGW